MSTQASNPVIDTITFICNHNINGNYYGQHNSKNPKYVNCINLCSFVDMNGITCNVSSDVSSDVFCSYHTDIIYQLNQYKSWKKAVEFHKKYVYCGKHWEKADEDGTIDIYHYINRERLNIDSIDELDELDVWDYDCEVWYYDDIWSFCGPYVESHINYLYPDDYEEQLRIKGLVKN